jgi:hypothetical protein
MLTVPGASAATDDRQVAQVGVLRLGDFPTGWKQTAPGADAEAGIDAQAAKITRCKPFAEFAKQNRQNPRATSPEFDLDQAHVSNTVSIYPSAARATAAIALVRDSKLPGCLEQLYDAVTRRELLHDKRAKQQFQSVTTKVARERGIRIGDDAVVYQGTVDVRLKNGASQPFGLGFVTVRVGAALVGYAYTADTDISAALQPAIVASVTRLQRDAPTA